LHNAEVRLAGLIALTPGDTAHPYNFYASATASTSTENLQSAAAELNSATADIRAAQKRTSSLTAWLKDVTSRTADTLDRLTLGNPKSAGEGERRGCGPERHDEGTAGCECQGAG